MKRKLQKRFLYSCFGVLAEVEVLARFRFMANTSERRITQK